MGDVARGHAHRGGALEDLLDHQHAVYSARGIAAIEKTAAPVRFARGGAAFVGAKGPSDYRGTWGAAGERSIVAEAKSTAEDVWYASVIPQHQRDHLDTHHRMGAAAMVLLFWESAGQLWALPWAEVAAALRTRRATYRIKIPGSALIVRPGIGFADYLAAFAAWEQGSKGE